MFWIRTVSRNPRGEIDFDQRQFHGTTKKEMFWMMTVLWNPRGENGFDSFMKSPRGIRFWPMFGENANNNDPTHKKVKNEKTFLKCVGTCFSSRFLFPNFLSLSFLFLWCEGEGDKTFCIEGKFLVPFFLLLYWREVFVPLHFVVKGSFGFLH